MERREDRDELVAFATSLRVLTPARRTILRPRVAVFFATLRMPPRFAGERALVRRVVVLAPLRLLAAVVRIPRFMRVALVRRALLRVLARFVLARLVLRAPLRLVMVVVAIGSYRFFTVFFAVFFTGFFTLFLAAFFATFFADFLGTFFTAFRADFFGLLNGFVAARFIAATA
jgi:hypothetical protein